MLTGQVICDWNGLRRYFRKYDTMEVSGGSYTEQKSLHAGNKNDHFHN